MNRPNKGILIVNKPAGKTSFSLVSALRKKLGVKKIGHAGTLDPFATGVMVMLIGKEYTTRSNQFLNQDKEYIATLHLGIETDSYDCDGKEVAKSDCIPSIDDVKNAVGRFQGMIQQIPPMFSAKKKDGKKLCDLARKGIEIEREPVTVHVETEILEYSYPFLKIHVKCSKGTYVRSIAYDLGKVLGCGAHLSQLERTQSGAFSLEKAIDGDLLFSDESPDFNHYMLF